jgi:hypothetical protein
MIITIEDVDVDAAVVVDEAVVVDMNIEVHMNMEEAVVGKLWCSL